MSNLVGDSHRWDEIGAGQGNHEAGEGREDIRPPAMLPVVINHSLESDMLKTAVLLQLSRGLILAYSPRVGA